MAALGVARDRLHSQMHQSHFRIVSPAVEVEPGYPRLAAAYSACEDVKSSQPKRWNLDYEGQAWTIWLLGVETEDRDGTRQCHPCRSFPVL